ncbi:MAG TPA: hypothetical protein VFB96_00915 [Pirellulaceae bacterium]|jgi:hypothetical protein|nr:hypothetical protein [Pirellulaceae bacterium]
MSKLISITAIAVAALLTALPAVDMSPAGKPPSQPVAAQSIPPKRALALAVDFHARLLMAASERLDSTLTQACRDTQSAQRVASRQEVGRPDGVCPR